ncbi:MAG: sensor of ECF-type sigma factor [Flavobacteriaceae bacterium]|nr:sensor of ECF-type sigma factor [Flavobacteriaceae bacterium]
MKRIIPFILILMSFSLVAQSPNRGKNKERIKALKIAFITERLDLNEKEAEKFWPVYNAFDDKQSKIKFEEMRKLKAQGRQDFDTMNDKEASDLLDKIIAAENKLHNYKVEFINDLKSILPAKKIMLLKSVEDDFNRRMLEEFKKRRQGRLKN